MTTFVHFTRRTNDPKLLVLEQILQNAGIASRRSEITSSHAPILDVPASGFDEAEEILGLSLADIFIQMCEVIGYLPTYDLTLRRGLDITFDDVPDDDPAFLIYEEDLWWHMNATQTLTVSLST